MRSAAINDVDSGNGQPQSLGRKQPRGALSDHVEFAERSDIDNRDDESKKQGGQLVSQAEQPEEKRNCSQFDADACHEQGSRPIRFTAGYHQFAQSERHSRDDHCSDIGQLCRPHPRIHPNQGYGEQST